MTNKSHQAASKYARRSGQRKRNQQPRYHHPVEAKAGPARPESQMTTGQQAMSDSPKQTASPTTKSRIRGSAPTVAATYAYISSDLKRTGIITASIFVLLIVLSIVFG